MTFSKKLSEFIKYDLWRNDESSMSVLKRTLTRTLKTIVVAVHGFGDRKLNIRANHLTYSLLFALVPIMALIAAIAKGFGFSDLIDQLLAKYALNSNEIITAVNDIVNRYVATSNNGLFIGIGLIILISAAYIFFRNVELAFNEIWNVQNSRSITRQSLNYIAILFLIPVLVIVTSGLSIYLHTTAETWDFFHFLSTYRDGFINFVQFMLLTIVFTWMYIAIPNTQVRFKSALIPGLIIALLLMGIEALSVYLMVLISRMSIVYGAVAFFPILLIIVKWLNLFILSGAELSFAIQNNAQFNYHYDLQRMSRRYKDFLTIRLLSIIIQRFNTEQEALTANELAQISGIPIRQTLLLLSRLETIGILNKLYVENKEEQAYQPAHDSHLITTGKLFNRIDQQGAENFLDIKDPNIEQLWHTFIQHRQQQNNYDNQPIN
ncbi:MAG: YihY/virulence factor BrkB family protein [Paludibacteraceae bacterium]|nr:YihY/virulence factor BrkB family protein [Paludibacteraceae bacterium]